MALHLTLSGIMALYLTLFGGTNRLMLLNPTWWNWPAQTFIWPCTVLKIRNICIFPEMKLHGLSPDSYIHVSMSDLYSPRIGLHISSSRIGRPIVEIYNSLSDVWMWKLGLRPQYSFSGNICFEISAFCLCSAEAAQFLFWEYKNRNFFAVRKSPPVRTAGQLRRRRLRPYGPRWTQRRRDCSSRPFDLKENIIRGTNEKNLPKCVS